MLKSILATVSLTLSVSSASAFGFMDQINQGIANQISWNNLFTAIGNQISFDIN